MNKMTSILSVFLLVVFLWNGYSADWMVNYATGLAQLAIWCTLGSLVPFVSLWVSLKQSAFAELKRTQLRTHWSSFLKYS